MSLPRLLAGTGQGVPLSLAEHEAVHGPLRAPDATLIDQVEAAGLRGRGGAAFPAHVKMRTVARQRGSATVLVNAAEGEPMSFKDRVLLELAPHLVLDGAAAAAAAVGAKRIVVAVREDATVARQALRTALGERRHGRRIEVVPVPAAYLAGQETALIRHLDGGPLLPTLVPPLPAERGLRRRPTLVQNPETLAHMALIARHGAAWFRAIGTAGHPGSMLLTVGGAVSAPGVLEVAGGTTLDTVLNAAGGPAEPLRAVLVSGFHGTWFAATGAGAVALDDGALMEQGAGLGAGVIVALGASACPVQELGQTVGWLAAQSAHQCGPCHQGLPALAGLLAAVAAGTAPRDWQQLLARWTGDVTGRGACHLPDGAARFVASGVHAFGAELAQHAEHGPCRACRRPVTMHLPRAPRREALAA